MRVEPYSSSSFGSGDYNYLKGGGGTVRFVCLSNVYYFVLRPVSMFSPHTLLTHSPNTHSIKFNTYFLP